MSFPSHNVYITENHPDDTATLRPNEAPAVRSMGPLMQMSLLYSAPAPLVIEDNSDLKYHVATSKASPLIFFPPADASAACIVDFAPNPDGQEGIMHKSESLDYLIILEGELELELLGGEKKILKKGEILIQRECYHSWRNASKTEPARFLAIAVGVKGATGGEMIPWTGE